MPWYWTDDIAVVLVGSGKIGSAEAAALTNAPVAYHRDTATLEEVAVELAEEGEIPLAA